jgi:hypothetical protein
MARSDEKIVNPSKGCSMSDTRSGRTKAGAGSSASGKGQKAKRAGQEAAVKADSPWVKALGQVGVAAIGIVYLLLAWISVQIAFGGSSQSADNSGALKELADKPFGQVLLGVMALGLFAFAVWQLILAAIGFQQEDDTKRVFKRVSAVAKAVFGLVLGIQAATLTFSGGGGQSSSSKQGDWTGKLLGQPGGKVLVVLIGLAVLGFAGYLVYQGVEKKFLEKLEGGASRTIVRLGQVGWIARGAAFGVLGVLVVVAGVKKQPEKARGLDNALKTLADQPFGKWLLVAVAFGFAAYGVFQLVTARTHKEG